jgi:serine/threonine protein kinase/WD40 repeat protein
MAPRGGTPLGENPRAQLSIETLFDQLNRHQLLEPAQQRLARELAPRFCKAQLLADELVRREWLTPFQVAQLLQGRGAELVLGSYRLLEPLGKGGMGQVFKARHQLMKRVVALKVIRQEFLAHPQAVNRFRREIQLIARLAHPNIVMAHDAEQVGNVLLLVMEFCEGPTLERLVEEVGPLAVGQACAYIRQATLGLHHAWERGVVHRDIKPSNLLVAGTLVKILDLGLAGLRLPVGEAAASHTTPGSDLVLGTPDYMAPEQANDLRSADTRSDLYSLGCTFYHLLAGRVPFPGGSAWEKLLRHQVEQPFPLAQLRPDLPPVVGEIVGKLLAKNPAQRYQKPVEVAAALAPFARSSQPVSTVVLARPSTVEAPITRGAPPLTDPDPPSQPALQPQPAAPAADQPSSLRGAGGSWTRGAWFLGLAIGTLLLGYLVFRFAFPTWPPDGNKTAPLAPPNEWQLLFDLPHADCIYGVAFSTDARVLAVAVGGCPDGPPTSGVVKLWDVATGKIVKSLELPAPGPQCVAFSPDGKFLAAGLGHMKTDGLGAVYLWDARTWELRQNVSQPHGILTLAFAPNSGTLAVAGRAKAIELLDLTTGTPRFANQLQGHTDTVNSVAFSPNGDLLASGASDRTVRLWNVAARREVGPLTAVEGCKRISQVAFSPDGSKVAAVTNLYPVQEQSHHLIVWEVATRHLTCPPRTIGWNFSSVVFTPESKELLTADQEGFVRLWNLNDPCNTAHFQWHHEWAEALALSPDGGLLASGGKARTGPGEVVKLWRVRRP